MSHHIPAASYSPFAAYAQPPEVADDSKAPINWNLMWESKNIKKVKIPKVIRRCEHCGTNKTPNWRPGPNGRATLCNAHGAKFKKLMKKELEQETSEGKQFMTYQQRADQEATFVASVLDRMSLQRLLNKP